MQVPAAFDGMATTRVNTPPVKISWQVNHGRCGTYITLINEPVLPVLREFRVLETQLGNPRLQSTVNLRQTEKNWIITPTRWRLARKFTTCYHLFQFQELDETLPKESKWIISAAEIIQSLQKKIVINLNNIKVSLLDATRTNTAIVCTSLLQDLIIL